MDVQRGGGGNAAAAHIFDDKIHRQQIGQGVAPHRAVGDGRECRQHARLAELAQKAFVTGAVISDHRDIDIVAFVAGAALIVLMVYVMSAIAVAMRRPA